MSQYLVHWTDKDSFAALLRIGAFIAGSASRSVGFLGAEGVCPTIYGGSKVVCFSETPIGNYLQSVDANPRYTNRQYGIALHKSALYAYGARPVLYGDPTFLRRLDKSDRYLYCRYRYSSDSNRVDWTHEREWRVRSNMEINSKIGLDSEVTFKHGVKGKVRIISGRCVVPIHLPDRNKRGNFEDQLPETPHFIILVKTEGDKETVKEDTEKWQRATAYSRIFYSDIADYRTKYLAVLGRAQIVSLEQVRDGRDHRGIWRLEDFIASTDV